MQQKSSKEVHKSVWKTDVGNKKRSNVLEEWVAYLHPQKKNWLSIVGLTEGKLVEVFDCVEELLTLSDACKLKVNWSTVERAGEMFLVHCTEQI